MFYAIEAFRVFDHLRFRNVMQEAAETMRPTKQILQKPIAISGRKEPWFVGYLWPAARRRAIANSSRPDPAT